MVADFRQFIKDKGFSYKSTLEAAVEDLKKTVTAENEEPTFAEGIKHMEEAVTAEKEKDFDRSLPYIKKAIQREIIAAVSGERGVYEHQILKADDAVKEAVRVLTTPKEYGRLVAAETPKKKS